MSPAVLRLLLRGLLVAATCCTVAEGEGGQAWSAKAPSAQTQYQQTGAGNATTVLGSVPTAQGGWSGEWRRSSLHSNWIVVPEHRLLFCYIEKVGCAAFNDLFRSLRSRYDSAQGTGTWWARNSMYQHDMTAQELDALVLDPTWHKAVFYREPLERFLSGFRSKCEPGHDEDRANCEEAFGHEEPTFMQAFTRLQHKPVIANRHWRPQSEFCGGLVGSLHRFQTVEKLDRDTSRAKVGALLQALGVEPESVPAFNDHFPPTPTADAAAAGAAAAGAAAPPVAAAAAAAAAGEGVGEWVEPDLDETTHATNAAAVLHEYYAYPAAMCEVVKYYALDYIAFHMPVPEWARAAVCSERCATTMQRHGVPVPHPMLCD